MNESVVMNMEAFEEMNANEIFDIEGGSIFGSVAMIFGDYVVGKIFDALFKPIECY